LGKAIARSLFGIPGLSGHTSVRRQRAHVKGRTSVRPYGWFWDFFMPKDIKIYQTEADPSSGDLLTWFYSHRLYLIIIIMSTHQSLPKPANANKKSDIQPIPAQSRPHPVVAQPKIESTLHFADISTETQV